MSRAWSSLALLLLLAPLLMASSYEISGGGGGGGGGTVTSVGLALPLEFTVTGSPVTTAGTLTGAWASVAQRSVLAGPTGGAGTPVFRLLSLADVGEPTQTGTVNLVRDTAPTLTGPIIATTTFAALGTPGDGTIKYCSDCVGANPCAGSGTGAQAKRENGAWNCGAAQAVRFVSNPSNCVTTDQFATGISALGVAEGCAFPNHSTLSNLGVDDHTQYTKITGRVASSNDTVLSTTTGGILTGGSNSGTDLTLQSNLVDLKTGEVNIEAGFTDARRRVKVGAGVTSETVTATDRMIEIAPNYTMTGAANWSSMLGVKPTVHMGSASSILATFAAVSTDTMSVLHDSNTDANVPAVQLFWANQTLTSSVANTGPALFTLWDSPVMNKTVAGALGTYQTIRAVPIIKVTGAFAATEASAQGLYWKPTIGTTTGAGSMTLGTASAVEVDGVAKSAGGGTETCNAQYGLKVNSTFTACTTNVGVSNASTTVYPSGAQTLSAAGNTITTTATFKTLTGNGVYTLSATPTLSPGQDGQMITLLNIGANTLTFQDTRTTAGTNIILPTAATTLALGSNDVITFVYLTAAGFWYTVSNSNN